MIINFRARPYPDIGPWTEVCLDGDDAEEVRDIMLNVMTRNEWEIDLEWEPADDSDEGDE